MLGLHHLLYLKEFLQYSVSLDSTENWRVENLNSTMSDSRH